MIPYENEIDVITPINILFIGGGEKQSLMKIKLMLYYPNQHTVPREWQILIPHGDIADVITPIIILFRGGGQIFDPS